MIITPYLMLLRVTQTNTEDQGALAAYVTPICFTQDSCCLSCQRLLAAAKCISMPLCLVLQKATPLAVLGALHFEAITDLAWSSDGSYLAISSYDGFCR